MIKNEDLILSIYASLREIVQLKSSDWDAMGIKKIKSVDSSLKKIVDMTCFGSSQNSSQADSGEDLFSSL